MGMVSCTCNTPPKNKGTDIYLYILRGFKKLVIAFFHVKNTAKLINQQLKNWVKIVNCKKRVSYCFFLLSKIPLIKT